MGVHINFANNWKNAEGKSSQEGKEGRNFDFPPEVKTNEGETLEVIEETKLLGIIVRSDLSWESNTRLFCEKGYSRLWILRNLKRLGANRSDLVDVPAWTPGLTQTEVKQLERVQKSACAIILGEHYISYKLALRKLNMGYFRIQKTQYLPNF